jgi:RimJ/RimL family protein N-acetyltransferase/aminoglycoside phosphotransferase (APT) family kinase protein
MRPDFVDYRVAKEPNRYQPTLAEIGRRYQLDVRDAAVDAFGVNTVFHLRTGEVIKLFTTAADSAEHEATVMNGLDLQAAGIAPSVLRQGAVRDCAYLVMSRLPGGPLLHAWDLLPPSARIAIREQLGAVLHRLHACALPTDRWPAVVRDNLPANTPPSWPAYLSARRQRTVARQRDKGCPPAWLRTMGDFLDKVAVHANCPRRLGLLHGELNADHVFVVHESGRWRVSGLLDFQAAMMGDPQHELAQAGFHCCVGEPAHLRALLRGYGYTDQELTRDLQLRFMAHFLLFAWCPFQRYIAKPEFNAGVPPGDFDALAAKWFDFGLLYKVSPPQAGIECSSQTGRRTALSFRQLTGEEESAGYQVICDTVSWLRGKGIKLWDKPLPRPVYAQRQQRGENYGLFEDGELAAVVSLVNGVPEYWRGETQARIPSHRPADAPIWLCTLATATKFRGRNLGWQTVREALHQLHGRDVYLDCKPGWLVEFYRSLGFEAIQHKTMTLSHGPCGPIEAVLMKWGLCPWTARLRLRPITASDVDNLLLIFGDPVAMEFWPRTKTREEVLRSIEWHQQSYRQNGYGLWAAELKETGEFVGRVGLIRQDDVAGKVEVEVAYALVPKFWRRGLATEAARACRDWAFERLDCGRVVSLVHARNLPSCRVAERNGMRIVAEITRKNLPHHVYAITRAEWEQRF